MGQVFKGKKAIGETKLRGAYYTPPALADYLVWWAMKDGGSHILEPSFGDGNFLVSLYSKISNSYPSKKVSITGVELETTEFNTAKKRVESNDSVEFNLINGDFFKQYESLKRDSFDVVIGNPPFIRFQNFNQESRDIAFSHLKNLGYKPSKLSNTWSAFVQLSIELLNRGGKIAMVLPAEIMQVNYASELRSRIISSFSHMILVTFKKLVFEQIQQEVVLLLAEGKKQPDGTCCDVHTIEISDERDLNCEALENKIIQSTQKHSGKNIKWTSFFLKDDEFSIINNILANDDIKKLGNFVDVDVGIVTGRNSYFVVDKARVKEHGLHDYVVPIVGRTSALKTIVLDEAQFGEFAKSKPSFLLNLKGTDRNLFHSGLKKYIISGENEGVHLGFKCRTRREWYGVPSVYVPDGFLFRQIHKFPLLVSNETGATSTDTIHRVRKKSNFNFVQLSASFINSLTFLACEIGGRSYGGGVLELEPNESERLPVPFFENLNLDIEYIKSQLELGQIEDVLDYVDNLLLIKGLGLSKREVATIRNAWISLRDRRIFRK